MSELLAADSSPAAQGVPGAPLAIEARGLVKQFGGRRALDGLDLELPQGGFLSIFGPNGAGKTTLLRELALLARPTGGELRILGVDALEEPDVPQGGFLSIFGPNGAGKTTLLRELALLARPTGGELRILGVDALEEPDVLRSRIGLISHKSMLYGDLTARENLAFFASLYGLEGPEADARIDELLRLVELDHRANDCARTFSRGMQQRLSIARALINDPELVLLDEPYSGLDPHAAELFDRLIARVRDGRTFVMVSHDLEKGFDLCVRTWRSSRVCTGWRGRRRTLASMSCCVWSSSIIARTIVPAPSRAACSSASPVPAPSSTIPSACCSTSRSRASIRLPRSASIA